MDEASLQKIVLGLTWEIEYKKLLEQKEYASSKFLTEEGCLDTDFAAFFDDPQFAGSTVLDIGTGTGEQAIYLAKKGFKVTATDVSASAINHAKQQATQQNVAVDFIEDNILLTKLTPPFDFIIDRGCYILLPKQDSPQYFSIIKKLLKPDGWLLIKADSVKKGKIKILNQNTELEIKNSVLSSYSTLEGHNVPATFFAMQPVNTFS